MSGGGRSLAGAAAETDTAQEVNLSKVPRRSEWTTLSKAVIESHPASFATRSAMDVMIDVMKLVAADNHLVQVRLSSASFSLSLFLSVGLQLPTLLLLSFSLSLCGFKPTSTLNHLGPD